MYPGLNFILFFSNNICKQMKTDELQKYCQNNIAVQYYKSRF